MRELYFGDNLDILRAHVPAESVDLVYLDPPFNSKRDYNLLFKTPKGQSSDAQITAFEDSWHWGTEHGSQAEREYDEILHQPNTNTAELIRALRKVLGENDMMAYLVMMTNRLLELHRVLKPTGSLYLHCDPTASHYLKIVLDAVFGPTNFRNEIVWKRTSAHNDAKNRYASITDTILFCAKSPSALFHPVRVALDPEHVARFYNQVDEKGRRYALDNLRSPNPRPNLTYDYKGYKPHRNGWAVSREKMEQLDAEDRLYFPEDTEGRIRLKRYLDENKGQIVPSLWDDIPPLQATTSEALGYPTQKPLSLLERVIKASSNEGDVVLDPFCGCGTAIQAAQSLGRQWIGIDITHLAISLIEKRLRDAFPGITFVVHGTPKDLDGARNLAARDKYQFQWWACSLVNAQPYQGKKKGADGGTDGLIYFQDDASGAKTIIVSVKGGDTVNRAMVADLKNSVDRDQAQLGLFVTLTDPTAPMLNEAAAAGFYTSPANGRQYPKIQILTIAGLLGGSQRAEFPDLSLGTLTHRQAPKAKEKGGQKSLFEQ